MRAGAVLLLALSVAAAGADVSELLEPIRQRHGLPALAAAAMADGRLLSAGATGVRRLGGAERVTVDDKWHLGSCTKSMTATLAALLVEKGRLKWDTTVGDAFPDLAMNEAWRGVTLELLLGHRAGAPPKPPGALWAGAWKRNGSAVSQRMEFVSGLLTLAPDPPPKSRFVYSNQGYSIAGAMMERLEKMPWEALLTEMVFEPLGMKSAGFGAPGRPGAEDQPWGHRQRGVMLVPVPPGPEADNPPAIGPGGIVHASIVDFVRYAAWHAAERDAKPVLLSPASFQKLHTPLEGQDYALGWNVSRRGWAGGRTLFHNGTNTMNFAVMWLAPRRNFAVVAATNAGGPQADKACDEAVGALIQQWEKSRR
jgi:CubicO group peptidase (beta-lactamase class C family)